MLQAFLSAEDARRGSEVLDVLGRCGLAFALTGSLALDALLRALGRATEVRKLNDLDVVVAGIEAVRDELADAFLINHIHPAAHEGKLLLQLVHVRQALRVDVFRTLGGTLSRTSRLAQQTGDLEVLAAEDLRGRLTAHVCMSLGRGLSIDGKYVRALARLDGCGEPGQLQAAWNDHREGVAGGFDEAAEEALRLIAERPDLIVAEQYLPRTERCAKCQPYGRLRPADPGQVVAILGYS